MDKLYNITETAKLLSVGRATIYRWIKADLIQTISINGLTRVRESEIKRLRGEK